MSQFSERKKLILNFLIINCGIHHLTEEEAMKYIKFNFGKDISRRTYYNYKKTLYDSNNKESILDINVGYPGLPLLHDLAKSNKGLISMALMIERTKIIKKGLEKGIKLEKYEKCNFHPKYYQKQFSQTKDLLDDVNKLTKSIR